MTISYLTPSDENFDKYRIEFIRTHQYFTKRKVGLNIKEEDFILNYIKILKKSNNYPECEVAKLYEFFEESNPPFNSISIPIEVYNYMLSNKL